MSTASRRDLSAQLAALDAKVNALLPPRYQHCYGAVSPVSMGSATLKFGPDGKIAWDQIWTTFCDLALAGGPPHRGKLLEAPRTAGALAEPEKQAQVVAELARALKLTSNLATTEGHAPGWIGLPCASPDEAGWLQFAIQAENVTVRRRGSVLQLPAGPDFRPEKEIKNVVVAVIKSLHYWDGHLTGSQQLLGRVEVVEPATIDEVDLNAAEYEASVGGLEDALRRAEVPINARVYPGWVGIPTASDEEAVWLLRAVVVDRILARREDTTVYVPAPPLPRSDWPERVAYSVRVARELRAASATTRRASWTPRDRS